MALDLLNDRGCPLDRQEFTWKDMVQLPLNKLNDDAFTRVRVILMNGIEAESLRFGHLCARMNRNLQIPLAKARRVSHFQQTAVNWLLSPDHSPLETTLGFEQVAVEVTASLAQNEPDPYLAQAYRFGLLEDFDHLYRYSAFYDRLEGKDPNTLLQSYTDLFPGRPTSVEHRAPENDVRRSYNKDTTSLISKLNTLTLVGGEYQTHDYYMTVGPQFADPVARMLYAEIAAIEEQHVTHYESLADPDETWLEKWLLHAATETYNYWSCVESEGNPRIKALWERFLENKLGQVQYVAELYKTLEKRDPAALIGEKITTPIAYKSHRGFIREVLQTEVGLRTRGFDFVNAADEPQESLAARTQLNSTGSPSELVAAGYIWRPGGELTAATTQTTFTSMSASSQTTQGE